LLPDASLLTASAGGGATGGASGLGALLDATAAGDEAGGVAVVPPTVFEGLTGSGRTGSSQATAHSESETREASSDGRIERGSLLGRVRLDLGRATGREDPLEQVRVAWRRATARHWLAKCSAYVSS